MIRVIMTSTLWQAFLSSTSGGWKTRCSLKNVSSTSYPPPVSHITGKPLAITQLLLFFGGEIVVLLFPVGQFVLVSVPFFLLFSLSRRARLWCGKSSSPSSDHRDPAAACDHCHEILVCIFKSVSPVTAHFVEACVPL